MELWTGAQRAFAMKAFYKNGDRFVIARREFRREFGIHRNRAVPSVHAIKTWVRNFEATGSTLKKEGGSVKTVRTPKNIVVVREAIERRPRRSARRHSLSLGLSEARVRRNLNKYQSSWVEKSNSARSHRNPCGDASKSNWWRSHETLRVCRAEVWSSEWRYFRKVWLLFLMC